MGTWENILKLNTATNFLSRLLTISRDISAIHEVKLQASIISRSIKEYSMSDEQKLNNVKDTIRTVLEQTWLPDEGNLSTVISAIDPYIIQELNKAGHSVDDVDWSEVGAAVLSSYDKAINKLTMADIQ
tara:strand:+ start:1095 stop:1481 length:387 start_codon:yes stop_codon:yes gene_type:complete